MLPHRRSTLTFLRQADESRAPVQRTFEDSPGIKFTRRQSFTVNSFPTTPPRGRTGRRNFSLGASSGDNDENHFGGGSSAASSGGRNRQWGSARKQATKYLYRHTRRLVKRNTIGAPSAATRLLNENSWNGLRAGVLTPPSSRQKLTKSAMASTSTRRQRDTFPHTAGCARRLHSSPSTPSATQKNAGVKATTESSVRQLRRRRSSGAFMVDVEKRKVIDASPGNLAQSFGAGRLTSDTFSTLESRALSNVRRMLQNRYSGGDIPQVRVRV